MLAHPPGCHRKCLKIERNTVLHVIGVMADLVSVHPERVGLQGAELSADWTMTEKLQAPQTAQLLIDHVFQDVFC